MSGQSQKIVIIAEGNFDKLASAADLQPVKEAAEYSFHRAFGEGHFNGNFFVSQALEEVSKESNFTGSQ